MRGEKRKAEWKKRGGERGREVRTGGEERGRRGCETIRRERT